MMAVKDGRDEIERLKRRLNRAMDLGISQRRETLTRHDTNLTALSPQLVLNRGYSIIRDMKRGEVITRASQVTIGASLDVVLADGSLEVVVERSDDGKKEI